MIIVPHFRAKVLPRARRTAATTATCLTRPPRPSLSWTRVPPPTCRTPAPGHRGGGGAATSTIGASSTKSSRRTRVKRGRELTSLRTFVENQQSNDLSNNNEGRETKWYSTDERILSFYCEGEWCLELCRFEYFCIILIKFPDVKWQFNMYLCRCGNVKTNPLRIHKQLWHISF